MHDTKPFKEKAAVLNVVVRNYMLSHDYKLKILVIFSKNTIFQKKIYVLIFVDMCGVEESVGLCDLNVTVSRPALATRHYTLCAVGQ